MKIISYNIHKGFSFANRKFVLQRIREVLEITNADLIFLQEVQGEHAQHEKNVKDWPEASQFEYLADRLWPHYAYGKNAIYNAGHHGNAILSKHSFESWENIDVTTNRFEKRGILHAVIKPKHFKEPLHALCIHLDLLESGREQQVQLLCKRIKEHIPNDAPLVIAGDFNDWRLKAGKVLEAELNLHEVHKTVHGAYAKSFPCWLPILRLDRIYCRGFVPVTAECLTGKPWNELSDHGALFAELKKEKHPPKVK
jgi:endonuclease/exonuclease/phosphatase family metal-dependent hydrolase